MSPAASQTAYLVKLKDRRQVAERTMAFQFEKPEGFTFKAGQSIDMTLINPSETDREGNGRAFSIASAPDEGLLLVATRMRDTAFKRVLGTMPIGSQVKIEGPFGNLVLHNNQARAGVFLAGGIGITPFRSILLRAAKEHLSHRLFLFYSNRKMPRFCRSWRPCNDKTRATYLSPP
jgi:ferredoxin-NADP reductase